ncbi:MAG TPA: hypothetical protein DCY07_04500 [Rhodospirillaceae bacterium]|nr:hypothetical protein [Rhodospirillaceae bacterium]
MAKHDTTQTMQMTEGGIKTLIRNALMVAGKEMGDTGDHWPVIKNTITDLMKDWEELEVERRVPEELRKHATAQLIEMEAIMKKCSPDEQEEIKPIIEELREVHDAYFTDVGEDVYDTTAEQILTEENKPLHVKRAEAILRTLEEDDE